MDFTGERFIPTRINGDLAIEHYQRYYSIFELIKGKNVLDAGSGEGYGSYYMAQYANKVIGVDISDETINHSKVKYKKDNLEYLHCSIEELPFDNNSFDIVVSFEVIEHVNEQIQKAFLEEVKRVLKQDGILVISTPDKYFYSDLPQYKNEFHIKEFYKEEFYNFLNNYFEFIDFYYQRFEIVSLINSNHSTKINLFQNESDMDEETLGKYIVAVCSNKGIKNIIDSCLIENKNRFNKQNDRIVQLQNEVEERNVHIKKLDEEINSLRTMIQTKNESINSKEYELNKDNRKIIELEEIINLKEKQIVENISIMEIKENIIKEKESELTLKNERIEEQQFIIDMNNRKIETYEQQLIEKQAHIEQSLAIINKDNRKVKELEEIIILKERQIVENISIIDIKGNIIKEKENELTLKNERIEEQQFIIDMNNSKIETYEQQLIEKQAHIEQLLERDRTLENIYQSHGWKLLTRYYKIRDLILPPNYKRRLYVKLVFKTLSNPRKMFKHINKDNYKKFFYYLKTENINMLENRIENYLDKHTIQDKKELQIYEYEKGNITKIVFNKVKNPLVSIIIPVYNQWEYTYSCLNSIKENTEGVDYEVIIADDVSMDETVRINEYIDNIKVIRNKKNKGFLLNCNNAAQHAKGNYIMFLNNDTNVQKDWLKYLIDLIESDKKIGMVGSKLVYKDGRLQEAGGIIWEDASGWNYGRLDDPDKSEYNYVKEVDYISGASIMIKTSLWKDIGGFDPRYVPAYFEDSDLAFEVRKRGYKVVYQPKSVVVHFEGISHGTDTSVGVKSYQIKNKDKFIEKWSEVLKKEHFANGEHAFLARDRSKDKKSILVIDHYVPHYDKDAGSRTIYQYLKLFKGMGYNVKFLGDNFYKHEPYTTELQQIGIEVLYGVWYRDNFSDWIKNNSKNIDYVLLNRPHISIKYIDLFKRYTKAKIIYYVVDLHYIREFNQYKIKKDEVLLKSSNKWKEIEYKLFESSNVIITISEDERKIIKESFPNKKVVVFPVFYYEKYLLNIKSFNEREGLLFVGGFSHTPNVDAILWFVRNIFPKVQRKLPNLALYIVGSNPTDEIKGLASRNIIVKGYISDEELIKIYQTVRMVVVPLRFGAGVKGKTIEAMYNRVPIVSTSFGIEGLKNITTLINPRNNEEDFVNEIINLYMDYEKLEKLSQEYLKYIQENFSKEKAEATMNSILKS